MKKNYKDMLLESESGFMMPFPLEDQEELQISLGYGEQQHPEDGTPFNHQGVDLLTNGKPLYAMASGMIIGAGHDSIHEDYIIAKHGSLLSLWNRHQGRTGNRQERSLLTSGSQIRWNNR